MPKNTSPSSSSARARAKKSSDTGAFTREERAAMKERADETRASREGKANGERALLEKIAELPEDDRQIAERLHALVKDVAPDLAPRTWYGMPAYEKDGKVLCFLQAASKFKTRYATLGFSDQAALDDGVMWPTSFAVTKLTPAVEREIKTLLRRAIG